MFKKTLRLNTVGADVKVLQQFLNKQGFLISKTGAGSRGKETLKFGKATRTSLMKFQRWYKLPVTGILDLKTRTKINQIIKTNTQK